MIDDKKIEDTFKEYNEKVEKELSKRLTRKPTRAERYADTTSRQCAFYAGAKWAINEFLKDLLHSYDEVPTREHKNILQFFEDYSADSEDDYDAYFELAHTREGFTQETWEDFMNIEGTPSSWLYIEDLYPKEGGE